ncbi:hypothetical protein B0H11DRAFT_2266731 [Mycena galericulata]|nr:hypothetical protein B0H11DRAFT_2266731 [Mycena galericulata]
MSDQRDPPAKTAENDKPRQMGAGERQEKLDGSMYLWKRHCMKLKKLTRRNESACYWHELDCDLCKEHGRTMPEDAIE